MAADQRSVIEAERNVPVSVQPDLAWHVLDSLEAQLAVIDHAGIIRYVNAAWLKSAREDGGDGRGLGVDTNYLAVCQPDVLNSLVAILNGELDHFEMEYECGIPSEERWYVMTALPLSQHASGWAVITHHNITRRKRVDIDRLETEQRLERAREQDSLAKLSGTAPAPITAQTFGLRALRENIPDAFERFVDYYSDLLEHAVQARTYKGEPPLPPRLKVMADQLVFLKAGPRDVIDVHMAALRQRSAQATPGEARIYAEEGRLLVLELMGHLAATYRTQAFGIKVADAEARSL